MPETKKSVKCGGCKESFEQNTGRGRPRSFCTKCRPPRAKK